MQTYFTFYKNSLCDLLLVGDKQGLSHIFFYKNDDVIQKEWMENDDFFKETIGQLEEYLQGKRKKFTIKLNPKGTGFQQKVWHELQKIPYGKTVSYGDIATRINNPKAVRAVGGANNKNPIPIIIPCHRVVGKNGSLVGYAGGLEIKKRLLEVEGLHTFS